MVVALSSARLQQLKAGATDWARGILSRNAVIMDTATTGFAKTDQICQIAIIRVSGEVLLDKVFCPTVAVNERARETHGLSDVFLANHPRFSREHMAEVSQHLDSAELLGWNIGFDVRMLQQTAAAAGLRIDDWPGPRQVHDAMHWHGDWVGTPDPKRSGQVKYHKLEGGDHSALGDCLAVLDRLRQMV